MKNIFGFGVWMAVFATLFVGCVNRDEVNMSSDTDTKVRTSPLYWSVYEYCWSLEKQGIPASEMDISEEQWDKIIDWVATELKPYGYDMVCTDGFIPMLVRDDSGYMTHYGSMSLKKLVEKCKARGLKVGVYDNPLWIHGADSTPVEGADGITFGDLKYKEGDTVLRSDVKDTWFSWVVVSHPGAKEYIDNFFKHFSQMGIDYIRMDFLSWYEDGMDRGMGVVGRGYGRDAYEQALKYISEAASKYGVFTSLVMPHLNERAALEGEYGDMVRIVADTGDGGWLHFSSRDRGVAYDSWPNCMNMFDGFVYWADIAGRGKVILDGDFIRLNTFASDAERESVVSLQLMAGGPVTVADQYNTIGDNVRFYQNRELLELNKDGFVGKPLSASLDDKRHQIWYGQLTCGDWVVGVFNRDDTPQTFSVSLSELGITGARNVRDMWRHQDEGRTERLDITLAPHACKIMRLSK